MKYMSTCEDHGCVVVYTEWKCPVCELVNEHEGCEKEVESLRERLEDAKSYADELADELAKYNSPVTRVESRPRRLGEMDHDECAPWCDHNPYHHDVDCTDAFCDGKCKEETK